MLVAYLSRRDPKTGALLLFGPPGCGKSSTVAALAAGRYDIYEFNGSGLDKNTVEQDLIPALRSRALPGHKPTLVVIEEVDGMFASDTYGPLPALKSILGKGGGNACICIGNDAYTNTSRALRDIPGCVTIMARRQPDDAMRRVLQRLSRQRIVDFPDAVVLAGLLPNAVSSIIAAAQGDIRQLQMHLEQYILSTRTRTASYLPGAAAAQSTLLDDYRAFTSRGCAMEHRIEMLEDNEAVGAMVYANYLREANNAAIQHVAAAAEALSASGLLGTANIGYMLACQSSASGKRGMPTFDISTYFRMPENTFMHQYDRAVAARSLAASMQSVADFGFIERVALTAPQHALPALAGASRQPLA